MATEIIPIDMTEEMFTNLKQLVGSELEKEVDSISFELFEEKDPADYDELATLIGEVKINAYFVKMLEATVNDAETTKHNTNIDWQDQD